MSHPLPVSTAAPSQVRLLAQAGGWRVSDVRCHRGPGDRRFEERHAQVSLAYVLSGTFQYRSARGSVLLYPGAVLIGAAGECFECGHEHGSGDHCLALSLQPALFDELAFSAAGDVPFRLESPMLPALRGSAALRDRLQRRLQRGDAAGVEESVLEAATGVVRALAAAPAVARVVDARDQRRVAAVARHIEAHCSEPVNLGQLAALACMSKFHFLRCFRRTLGVTPYQFVLQRRLERAARRLREGRERVADVALDCGFADLSGFTTLFRQVYGRSPAAYRSAT
jgi:AraC family transcriptional regulator